MMCAQWRLRSAWASTQSDQSLCCQHEERLGPLLPIKHTVKTLIGLGECPDQSESSLGAHFLVLSCGGSNVHWAMRGTAKIIVSLDRVKRIWYLQPMRAAKVHASLRIRAVSPEPSLLAHTSSESRGTFRQKARSLAPLNGWACAVKICHDRMLEDTNSLDGAQSDNLFFQAAIPKRKC